MPNLKSKNKALFFLLFYLAVRFSGPSLSQLHEHAGLAFDLIFSVFVAILYRDRFRFYARASANDWLHLFGMLVFGIGVFLVARSMSIPIPWDLTTSRVFFFGLILAPVLEELLFRQAIWFLMEGLVKKLGFLLFLNAAVFSAAHFYALIYVPAHFYSFVIYQGIYTFILGYWIAWRRSHPQQSYAMMVALHFCFNLGFFATGFIDPN